MSAFLTAGLLAAFAASPVSAFWRLPCKSPIVVERADPVVSPGQVSNHLHTIMGGNGFDFTMTYNSTQSSTCSSCTVTGDNSNYWIPALFYQHQNGTFESVDQIGGATVYYLQRAGDNETLKAFPPGFRMVAGDPFKRSAGTDLASQAVSYACLNYNGPATAETPMFPDYNCPDGLRSQVFFPSCWNGKDLDSADHKSHMSYPATSYNSGGCPADFPVHLVSIFYEVIWDTNKFADQWYGNSQPFVWSMGDPTGYGHHGDFINGWEDTDLLQNAIDQCTNESGNVEDCPLFDLIPDAQAEGCKVEPQVNEQVSGFMSALPGCNPIQAGPAEATVKTGCGATTALSASNATLFTDLTSQGWSYTGCGTDNYFSRILTGASESNSNMTNEACVAFCGSKGFTVAGTEYSDECYCGDSIPSSGMPVAGVVGNCQMTCAGDESEFCGGSAVISLYQKCTSSSNCTNAQFGNSVSGSIAVVSTAANSTTSSASSSSITAASSTTVAASQTTLTTVTTSNSSATTSAATQTVVQAVSSTSPTSSASSTPTSSNPAWSYDGCFTDTLNPRTLSTWSNFNGNNMTNDACISFCDNAGYSFAGTEYGGQCFCGDDISSTKLAETSCSMACTGASSEVCGGSAALSVWKKTVTSKFKMERRYANHLVRHERKTGF